MQIFQHKNSKEDRRCNLSSSQLIEMMYLYFIFILSIRLNSWGMLSFSSVGLRCMEPNKQWRLSFGALFHQDIVSQIILSDRYTLASRKTKQKNVFVYNLSWSLLRIENRRGEWRRLDPRTTASERIDASRNKGKILLKGQTGQIWSALRVAPVDRP